MKPPIFTPSTVLFVILLLLTFIFSVTWSDNSLSPSAAKAAAPQAENATDTTSGIVERWHGTVTYDMTSSSYGDCPWVCPGDSHYSDQQEWYFEVDGEGAVTGYVRTQVTAYSYTQSKTNNLCGPVAETPFTYNDCTYSGQLTQPNSMVLLQGVREIQQFTQRPILKITAANQTQECQSSWTARGIHSETGAVIHKEENANCTRSFHTPQTFYITTYENGRAPTIDLSYSSHAGGIGSVRMGHLTATTEEPFLELDRELLERSIFLDQIPIEELFTANMNWNSPDGGWITWQLSDADPERVGPTEEDTLPKPINNGMQGVGKKQLTVQAQSTLKQTSPPEVTQITVAPPPGWTGGPAEISATKVEGAVSYKSTRKFPEPPFNGTVTVPSIVPFLRGKPLGLKETQGSLSWEALSTTEGQGSISGQTGFVAMGKQVIGSLGGRARIVLDQTGVHIPEGGIDFGIGGTIASEPESLLSVVPTLRPALLAIEEISPRAAAFITERAQAKLELQPKLDFGFNFFTENDEIKFKNAEAKPSFGFKTIAEINLIKDMLAATASIGGAISATFQVPEPYFKEAALQGLVQAQITLWRLAWEGERAWSVTISGASAAIANATGLWEDNVGSGNWQPIARNYQSLPNYARWHGDRISAQAVSLEAEDELLVENVFPLANPSLHIWINSVGATRMVQAWAHDRPDAPAQSSGEIAVSRNFGTLWQSPTYLTNDDYDDLAPKPVYLTNSQVLVIWQRMDTTMPPDFNVDPAGYVSHWQIVAQRIGGDQDLEQLSIAGSLNYRHQLSVIADGALAVWVNNPANQLLGDTTNPDDILFARYTNATDSWSAAAPVLADVAGLLNYDLATNGDFGALVYALDMDGDLESLADQELFYVTWNGTTWSAPTRLTNNSVADENPELVLDTTGAPMLVWRQAGALKFLRGGWNNAPTDLPLPSAAERPDYELVQSSDGKLALVWQQPGPVETRIAYAIYDAAYDQWSDELSLPLPAGAEGGMATSMAAGMLPEDTDDGDGQTHDGGLMIAYQMAHVDVLTRTVDNVETGTGVQDNVSIANTIQIVQHDLRVATAPLRINLSVTASDLSIPAADKIRAVIHNTGDLTVENAPVVLHLGPAELVSGATVTVAQNIPLLAAGAATTVTFTVADSDESLFVVEIDPAGTLQESDRTDNRATLGTDIAIAPLPGNYSPLGVDVRATVTQQGNRYVSLLAPAILTVDAPDGTVVGGGQVGFPLAATDSITLSAFVSTTLLGAGRHHLYWTLDPGGSLGESDRSNNIAGTSIMILPDLAAADDTIVFGTASGSSAPFLMSVLNTGNWPSAPTVVEVYDAMPGTAASHSLLSLPLPAIEPGSSVAISGTLQLAGVPAATSGLASIFIQLDPDGEVEESNENNNLVAAGAVLEVGARGEFPLYMPAIER